MMQTLESSRRVVMLVDNRRRDLPVAALIARQLSNRGVKCFLEPLEAYRGALAAHRPHMIVFNHILASHLVRYSNKLADIGVSTAVLLNEGILYDEGEMRYNAGRFHNDAHIDFYFCWNEPHANALREEGFDKSTRIEVVGVPRFDFYKEPWSKVFYNKSLRIGRTRPKILACTNFVCAKFQELPRKEGDKFFAAWKDRIPLHRDYWTAIAAQHRARTRFFEFLDALASDETLDVVLRPHPSEDQRPYHAWHERQTPAVRGRVTLDVTTNITSQILDCDLEISCETCTTALEAWMADKPTVELIFDKYPLWFHEEHGRANVECSRPDELVPLVKSLLSDFSPSRIPPARQSHLLKWCHNTDGSSCATLADRIASALSDRSEPDWSKLGAEDHRRGTKLRALASIGLPYHFDPLLPLKSRLLPKSYAIKRFAYGKSIRPKDVADMHARLEQSLREEV